MNLIFIPSYMHRIGPKKINKYELNITCVNLCTYNHYIHKLSKQTNLGMAMGQGRSGQPEFANRHHSFFILKKEKKIMLSAKWNSN